MTTILVRELNNRVSAFSVCRRKRYTFRMKTTDLKPVHPEIIKKTEQELGYTIPEKFTLDGKDFRKYLAKKFEKQICIDLAEGQSLSKAMTLAGEQEASAFLNNIGVEFITWPYNWKNPDLGLNIAVLDDRKIKILTVHQVELDQKKQLIPGSEKEVKI